MIPPKSVTERTQFAAMMWYTALVAGFCLPGIGTCNEPAVGAVQTPRRIVVGEQYKTVQSAVDAIPDDDAIPTQIRIPPGTYKEKLLVPPSKRNVSFVGEDAKTTRLTNDWNASHPGPNGQPVGTSGTYSVKIKSPQFTATGITFENSAGDTGQAVAMHAEADSLVFRKCRFLGWQDTLYVKKGRQYFEDCYIEGRVDFIFGDATAVFDRCVIHSKNGGYVTAASTQAGQPFGYVFLDCRLTGEGAPAYLGRPWQPNAAVAFIRCEMGDHIQPVGWDNWRNPENERTARYREWRCTGPGANREHRVSWARELTETEAESYTTEKILAGSDGWNPAKATGK